MKKLILILSIAMSLTLSAQAGEIVCTSFTKSIVFNSEIPKVRLNGFALSGIKDGSLLSCTPQGSTYNPIFNTIVNNLLCSNSEVSVNIYGSEMVNLITGQRVSRVALIKDGLLLANAPCVRK